MLRTLLALTALACLGSAHTQDLRITEILPDQTGGDPVIELTNTGGAPLDPVGMNLCVQFQCYVLPSLALAPGDSVIVHAGVAGIDTATDVYTGAAFPAPGAVVEGVSLYLPGSGAPFFANPANIVDFVQYGAGNQPQAGVAVAAGIWPSTVEFAQQPFPDISLAWDGFGEGASNWFRDATPTLGGPNLSATAGTTVVGTGCGAVVPASLTPTSVPAFGNIDFTLVMTSGQPNAPGLLFIGVGTASFPVLQVCSFHVNPQPLMLEFPVVMDGSGGMVLGLFIDDVVVVGLEIGFQVVVQGAPGAFPKFDLTNGVGVTY